MDRRTLPSIPHWSMTGTVKTKNTETHPSTHREGRAGETVTDGTAAEVEEIDMTIVTLKLPEALIRHDLQGPDRREDRC